ncbi:MAG: hypothetical protein J0I79_30960 [Mesorhizobium sp.]|uniref:hypothetical protein n=1 Tax=Mesorhizobium sp. TaxID=1871066 RepID=UPI001AC70951|nr:hypothetical protein [Mesorhizobium sp.]MBN9222380.1 hypothetical protein [Mesorhizobium sp.]
MAVTPRTLKGFGYIVSTVSVLLLAAVSWESAKQDLVLALCLYAGAATSIIGMCCRWASYAIEEKHKRHDPSKGLELRASLAIPTSKAKVPPELPTPVRVPLARKDK